MLASSSALMATTRALTDVPSAIHLRTLTAFKPSDDILPTRYGYPFEMRIPTKIGSRILKFLRLPTSPTSSPGGSGHIGAKTGSAGYDAWDVGRTARSVSWRRRRNRD